MVVSSAHYLTMVNILLKFNENLSKGSGQYMELTRKCYDRWTDSRTDRDRQTAGQTKGVHIIYQPLRCGGLNTKMNGTFSAICISCLPFELGSPLGANSFFLRIDILLEGL